MLDQWQFDRNSAYCMIVFRALTATPITELNLIGHSNATMTGLSGTVNGQKTRFSLNEILALSQGSSSGDRRMKRKISVNPK